MADVGPGPGPFPGLEAELTCAICLDLFREPVTAPCGHNFCRACLSEVWAGDRRRLLGFTCPQCRAHFPERPELHPNRVLCAVVEELQRGLAQAQPPEPAAAAPPVPCDSCPPGPGAPAASRSCLSCLASFCPQHLEPHLLNAAFRSHNLQPPLPDLAQRRCPQHGLLLDLYCRPHRVCICAACLREHRDCHTQDSEAARGERQEELKGQQKNVRFQIIQLQHHLELVQYQKQHLADSSVKHKSALCSEFAEMKFLIEEEEKAAAKLIEDEESKTASLVVDVLDQLSTQLTKLKEYKEQLDSVLTHTGSMAFWKNIAELPVISLDTYTPPEPVELDGRKVELIGKAVSTLKQALARPLRSSLQQRVRQLEQVEKNKANPSSVQIQRPAVNKDQDATLPLDLMDPSAARNVESPQTPSCPEGKQPRKKKNQPNPSSIQIQRPAVNMDAKKNQPNPSSIQIQRPAVNMDASISLDTFQLTRKELMQCNSKVTLDHRTAHKKLVISDHYTTLGVADQPQSYPDQAERFFNCSQVLGLQSFSNGRHYWEVNNDGRSFWAVGVACIGMDRRGSRSRLGRNPLSWCVESFGPKLSAWHGDREIVLNVQHPRVVGVFLDFHTGFVAFYSVSNVMMLLFGFKAEFESRVLPAFWLSSNSTKLTIVQYS